MIDLAFVPWQLAKSFFSPLVTEGQTKLKSVMLFPGYSSDERYLIPLKRHLKNLGYKAQDWGLGFNLAGTNLDHSLDDLSSSWNFELPEGFSTDTYKGEAGVPYLCDLAIDKAKEFADGSGSPIALIGWSLGGYIAREVARELGSKVSHVITMGTPVVGGPKYTRGGDLFRARGIDVDWIEREVDKRNQESKIMQPITAIHSKSDGIVGWSATIDELNPNVEHIEVDCAHLGMGFNRQVWKIIEASLAIHHCKRKADT